MSYDEVARAVGYSHRGSAHRAVFKALAEQEVEAVEDLRALELARLDALQAAIWDDAMRGDTRAASAILRIIDQRVRLLGLQALQRTTGCCRRPQAPRGTTGRQPRGCNRCVIPTRRMPGLSTVTIAQFRVNYKPNWSVVSYLGPL